MGFFNALRRVMSHGSEPDGAETVQRLRQSWNLDAEPSSRPEPGEASAYDRAQWEKKLKRILDELPDSRGRWDELMAEARALRLGSDWVERCQREEFALLIRRAVADRHVTEAEHRKLDVARELIGIPEDEATKALHAIAAEAESFFGAPVKED